MSATVYLKGQLRAHIFRTASFSKPTHLYVSLHASDGTEASGGSYARVQADPADATWSTVGDDQVTNAADLTFPAPTADWGALANFGIYDADTGGNQLLYAALTVAKTVLNGQTAPKFPAGSLVATVA